MRGDLRSVYGALLVLCASTSIVTAAAHGAESSEAAQPIIAASAPPVVASPSGAAPPIRTIPSLRELPFRFEPNRGQADPRAKFIARSPGIDLYLTEAGAVLAFRPRPAVPSDAASSAEHRSGAQPDAVKDLQALALRLRFAHASPHPIIEGLDPLPGYSNYFIGNDPKRWHTKIPQFARVRYRDVYPGINVVYYGKEGKIEYDIEVAPGADLARIRERVDGADALTLDRDGDLIVHTALGDVTQRKPTVYQLIDGERRELRGDYVLRDQTPIGDAHEVAFVVPRFDRHRALVLDPTLISPGLIPTGGAQADTAVVLTPGAPQQIFLAGIVAAHSFPATIGTVSTPGSDLDDVFGVDLDASTLSANWAASFGGAKAEDLRAVAGLADGRVALAGTSLSSDYPATGGFGISCTDAVPNAFITMVSAGGSSLDFSGCVGSPGVATGVAVDPTTGILYTVYQTSNAGFLVADGFQTSKPPGNQGAVEARNGTTGAVMHSTWLAGDDGPVYPVAIAIDVDGNVNVAGTTTSTSIGGRSFFPVGPGGGTDGFIAKFDPMLAYLGTLSKFGGSGTETVMRLAVDGGAKPWVTGSTNSTDGPASSPDGSTTVGYAIQFSSDGTVVLNSATIAGATGSNTTVNAFAYDGFDRRVALGANSDNVGSISAVAPIGGLDCGGSCSAGTGGVLAFYDLSSPTLTPNSLTRIVNSNSNGVTQVNDIVNGGNCQMDAALTADGNLPDASASNPGGLTPFVGAVQICDPNALKPPVVKKRFVFFNDKLEREDVVGRTGTLQVIVTNPNTTTALTDFQVSDVLPNCANLLVGTTVDPHGCLDVVGPKDAPVIQATSLPPSSTCTVSFTIQAASAGPCSNQTDAPSASGIYGVPARDTVTITASPQVTWTGGSGVDNNMGNAANFANNVGPSAGTPDDVHFNNGATQFIVNNNLDPTVMVNLMDIAGGPYTFTGNAYPLLAGVYFGSANNVFSAPIVADAPLVVWAATGASATISGGVNQQDFNIVFSGGTTTIASTISGTTGNVFFTGGANSTITKSATTAGSFNVSDGAFVLFNASTPQAINASNGGMVGAGPVLFNTITLSNGGGMSINNGTSPGTVPLTVLNMADSTTTLFAYRGSEAFASGAVTVNGNAVVYLPMQPIQSATIHLVSSSGGHISGCFLEAESNLPNVALEPVCTPTDAAVIVAAIDVIDANGFGQICEAPPAQAGNFTSCYGH